MDEAVASGRGDAMSYVAAALAATGTIVLLAGILNVYAFVVRPGGDVGTAEFRALADAAHPFTALVLLGAVVLVVHGRRRDAEVAYDAIVLAVATVAALVAVLLALNGVVVAFMGEAINGLGRLSVVLHRLGTVAPAGYALWLAATAPARPGSRRGGSPPPSLRGDPGSESPP